MTIDGRALTPDEVPRGTLTRSRRLLIPLLALMLWAGLAALAASSVAPVGAFDAITPGPGSGGWCWFAEPRSLMVGDRVVYGFINGRGDVGLADTEGRELMLHKRLEQDDHDNPTIVEWRGSLLAFYTRHVGPELYVRRVETDLSSAGPEIDLAPQLGMPAYTYPSPVVLDGRLYLFWRTHLDEWTTAMWYSSSDDGEAWAPGELVYSIPGRSSYWKVATNGEQILIATSDGAPVYDHDASIWRFSFDGATFSRPELVNDDETAWLWDIASDGRIAVATYHGQGRADYRVLHPDGRIEDAGPTGPFIGGDIGPYYVGGISLSSTGWATSRWMGEAFHVVDQDGVDLTPGSDVDNLRPEIAGDTTLWLEGRYTTYRDYDQATRYTPAPEVPSE